MTVVLCFGAITKSHPQCTVKGYAKKFLFCSSENDEPQDEDVILLLTGNAYYIGRFSSL